MATRSEWTPYASAPKLGTADAEELLTLANVELTPETWQRLVRGRGELYAPANDDSDETAPVLSLTALWDRKWCERPNALAAAQRLQREVCNVLAALMRGDHAPVTRFLNSGGSFRCRVELATPASGSRLRRPTGNLAEGAWRLRWVPARPEGLRAGAVHALCELLDYAPRLGRCEHCARFFLRDTRWATRPRRFCGERCSVTFHNDKRLASGYFSKRRQRLREE